MGDINEAIATLNDLEYQWMKTPLYNPDFEGFEKVRKALEQQRLPGEADMVLRRIAYMGSDCPAAMEPEAFYKGQLYNCIALAAWALDPEANDG